MLCFSLFTRLSFFLSPLTQFVRSSFRLDELDFFCEFSSYDAMIS